MSLLIATRHSAAAPDTSPAPSSAARSWLGAGLILLGVCLAANSLIGPLVAGALEFHVTETLLNQMIGLDAVSLLVVAPLAVVAGVLVLRGHRAGPPLALGIGAYTAYMLVQYVLGPDYLHLPGDSQLLFPLYLVLFVLGWAVALGGWLLLEPGSVPAARRRERLVGRAVLPALAFLAFFRYLPALADAMSAQPTDGGYLAGPGFFWTIALLDLGVFLPATVAACVGLVRQTPWRHRALYLVVGWFALTGPAVAAMAIAMELNGDPNASGGVTALMVSLGLLFTLLAVLLYRPLFSRREAPSVRSSPHAALRASAPKSGGSHRWPPARLRRH